MIIGISLNAYHNVGISIIISIVGIIIGLLLSLKENSKVKYILYFIFGNIIYTFFWMIIVTIFKDIFIGETINNIFDFRMNYIYTFKYTIISYILVYATILVGNIIINKNKVEQLNKTLNGEIKQTKESKINIDSKYIKRIIIFAVLILIIVFVGNVIRKTIIINKYTKTMQEINEKNNLYVKEEYDGKSIYEHYYKDDIYVQKNRIKGVPKFKKINYYNCNTKEYITSDNYQNGVLSNEKYENIQVKVKNGLYNYYNYIMSPWNNIKIALEYKIKTEKIDGKECYVIYKDFYSGYMSKLYIDKENYQLIRMVNISIIGTVRDDKFIEIKDKKTTNYEYKFDVVTDEDVRKPNVVKINQ